ncbi:MAG: hypothetical protein EOQ28_20835 [Mesorhizobium sp.]|nr:MAG: hypothetical protein EOQ28_20835 [Mesorhizobium sp.]
MSTSRRALLSILSATVAFAAIIGIASAKGGGGGGSGGKHNSAFSSVTGLPVTKTNPKQVKSFASKACHIGYNCPATPIEKCDLQGNIEQSVACKVRASNSLTKP